MRPLAIDLFCGLGGWAGGLVGEGWGVVGFDIERHVYGEHRYPAQLVLQDVLTLHGSQFRDAQLIVESPPCQAYSYRAMPWKRAKALPPPDNTLFEACFRLRREACEAAGRHIPLVVENVRGAQRWVGRARWNFGSFYLWGDVPALMPPIRRTAILKPQSYRRRHGTGSWFAIDMASARSGITNPAAIGAKNPGFRFDGSGRSFQSESVKTVGHPNIRDGFDHTRHLTNPAEHEGVKQGGSGREWFDKALDERRRNPDGLKNPGIELGEVGFNVASAHRFAHLVEGVKVPRNAEDKRQHLGTKRKFASAMIAKIPLPLARHIGRVFYPRSATAEAAE